MIPESSNKYGASIVTGSPSRLIISAPSLTILAVIGCSSFPDGTPPPKQRYALPLSSTSTAGSNNHSTVSHVGVSLLISCFPRGSVQGPSGESAVRTPIPLPLSAKYKKNFSFPSIVLCAAHGAHELLAHLAAPSSEFLPATGIAPWSVQLAKSVVEKQLIVVTFPYEFSLTSPSASYS